MRKRDTRRWPVGTIYSAPEYFSPEHVAEGLHVIQLGNQLLDVLIRDRNSPATVVTFQHRVSVRTSYPTLVGDGFTRKAGVNLVAIADPSVALAGTARLAWYLGNRDIGHLHPILGPIIDTAVAGLHTERLIFFGNSGGGYPALQYAAEHRGAIGFSVNPMLGFNNQNSVDFADYMKACHPGLGRTAYQRVYKEYAVDLADLIPSGADFHAAMYHNINDQEYYRAHHGPFVDKRRHDLDIWERFEHDEEGHTPIPRDRLVDIIRVMSDVSVDTQDAIANAGFVHSA